MSWLPPGKPKRPRGRPVGTGKDEPSVTAIRVTAWTKVFLNQLKDEYKVKTYDAALRAYIRHKGHKIGELQKKVDALSEELIIHKTTQVNNVHVNANR